MMARVAKWVKGPAMALTCALVSSPPGDAFAMATWTSLGGVRPGCPMAGAGQANAEKARTIDAANLHPDIEPTATRSGNHIIGLERAISAVLQSFCKPLARYRVYRRQWERWQSFGLSVCVAGHSLEEFPVIGLGPLVLIDFGCDQTLGPPDLLP